MSGIPPLRCECDGHAPSPTTKRRRLRHQLHHRRARPQPDRRRGGSALLERGGQLQPELRLLVGHLVDPLLRQRGHPAENVRTAEEEEEGEPEIREERLSTSLGVSLPLIYSLFKLTKSGTWPRKCRIHGHAASVSTFELHHVANVRVRALPSMPQVAFFSQLLSPSRDPLLVPD